MTSSPESFLDGKVTLFAGDCLDVLEGFEPNSFDACVTDPPYGLGFMGKAWDHGVPGVPYWKLILRVLKPGAHLLAFGGTRTFGRMQVAIEDAGFEIRDTIMWLYGSGFPKSLDVSKAIDKAAGAQRERIRGVRSGVVADVYAQDAWSKEFKDSVLSSEPITDDAAQWSGFGTALKPACEPIVLARKPLEGTVSQNVLKWGTGALNIDGCRVEGVKPQVTQGINGNATSFNVAKERRTSGDPHEGRWPANVIHDGSEEVVAGFPTDLKSGDLTGQPRTENNIYGSAASTLGTPRYHQGDSGSAARYFYTAKADADDRLGSKHPTVKPLDLKQYLCRLAARKGALILDPFAGTGTTGEAAFREGMRAVLIERESEYQNDIRRRMALVMAGPEERRRESAKTKPERPFEAGSLFASLSEKDPPVTDGSPFSAPLG